MREHFDKFNHNLLISTNVRIICFFCNFKEWLNDGKSSIVYKKLNTIQFTDCSSDSFNILQVNAYGMDPWCLK